MSHNIYTIYKATNTVNGKVYIGFDSKWPKRQTDHKTKFKTQEKEKSFYRALKKYGWEAFSWEIIYQSKEKAHTLNEMEPFFIKENKSKNKKFGYNLTDGGEGIVGFIRTKEHNEKISLAQKGKKLSQDHIKKLQPTLFKKGMTSWCKGKKIGKRGPMSEETKQKLREKALQRKYDKIQWKNNCKKVWETRKITH